MIETIQSMMKALYTLLLSWGKVQHTSHLSKVNLEYVEFMYRVCMSAKPVRLVSALGIEI